MPVEEIRGFSLVREERPPVIVISSQDSPNGRIFTLFHEYSHILLEESGLCIPSEVIDKGQQDVEKFCNEFAGNFLVPTHHLKESIKKSQFSKIQEEKVPGKNINFGLQMWLFKKKQQGYFFADFIGFSLDKSN